MKALIIYDTVFGNTRQIAEAIASGLSAQYEVNVLAVAEIDAVADDIDLLLIGGPTHRHGLSDGMRALFERWPVYSLHNIPVATFDTRYRGPGWLMGSAARRIGHMIRQHDGHLAMHPESFFVTRDHPAEGEKRHHERELLEAGELERAEAWGRWVAEVLTPVA